MNRTHISSGIMSRMRVFESTDSSNVTSAGASNVFAVDSPKHSPKLVPTPILTAIQAGAIIDGDQCENNDNDEHSIAVTNVAHNVQQSSTTTTTTTTPIPIPIAVASAAETTTITMMMSSPPPGVQTDADGLILPKKLINPCLESTDRKQLHRELKFNNKIGKSVLNQKTELQRAYEKQRERQQQHQLQQQQQQQAQDHHSPTAALKGELSRVIMERAQKHERHDSPPDADEEDKQYVNPEYLNARAKLRTGQRAELK